MPSTASRIATHLILLAAFLAALSVPSHAGAETVESDPRVVRILPKHYPLDRKRVAAREYPWSAIGLVSVLGGRSTCTGTLVAERYVLTAAHCAYLGLKFPREIHFLAGYEQERYVAHSRVKKVYVSKAYRPGKPSLKTFANDWALLELEKPIGKKAGYLGWASLDADALARRKDDGAVFRVSGYRGDRRFVQTVDYKCRVTGFTPGGSLIVHRCPITHGDSGGPILMPYGREWLVVGIDVGLKGKSGRFLKRGERRTGYGVPTATLRDKLAELGIGGADLKGARHLFGRVGRRP